MNERHSENNLENIFQYNSIFSSPYLNSISAENKNFSSNYFNSFNTHPPFHRRAETSPIHTIWDNTFSTENSPPPFKRQHTQCARGFPTNVASTSTLSFLRNQLQSISLHSTEDCLQRLKSMTINDTCKHSAFLCAFTSDNTSNIISLDTNSVALVIDTGATAAFTHCMRDVSSFTPFLSKVEGLGSLIIQGIDTLEFKFITDNGTVEILSISNAYSRHESMPDFTSTNLSTTSRAQLLHRNCLKI